MNVTEIYKKPDKDLESLKNILLIGTSEYGVTNEVIEIKNEEELIKTYGKSGTIYDAYSTIASEIDDYNISLYVLKPYGVHAQACFNLNTEHEITENTLIFKSVYSNEIYNNIYIEINAIGISITFPSFLRLSSKVYCYKDYNTVQSLIDKINEDTINGENVILAYTNLTDTVEFDESFFLINSSKNLSGGKSDLYITNNMEKYNALNISYDLVKGIDLDYIALTDIHYNDIIINEYGVEADYNFYTQLHELCIGQLQFGIITLGVMAFDTSRYTTKEESINKLLEIESKFNNINKYDNLRFLMLVIYDYLFFDYRSKKINPSVLISFTISKYKKVTNIIDKPFDDSISLNNFLELEELKLLSDKGFIGFKYSPYYDNVTATGVTNYTLTDSNEYKYLTTISMMQNILTKIKLIFEKYIGESIYMLNQKRVIDDEILNLLNKQRKIGNIDKSEFSIQYNLEEGKILYELTLKNIYMTEGIKYIGRLM